MCVTPITLRDGQEVACRKCWQCNENRINDWVGRCIAESHSAKAVNSITLTYGRDDAGNSDHIRAAVLTFSDVQKYMKLLRRHGYPCRYFAVGEHGAMKGRSHWHLIVFWQGEVPKHVLRKKFDERHWPHGHSFWDGCTAASIRYVCKYITKDARAMERQGHLSMSKKPPLGFHYFAMLASRHVEQGLSPQSAFYHFHEAGRARPVRYMLKGRSLDLFCESFVRLWRSAYPDKWWPTSDLIEDWCDRQASLDFSELRLERYAGTGVKPFIPAPGGADVLFSDSHNAYYCLHEGRRLWWSFDIEGNRSWQDVIRTEAGSPSILREAALYRAMSGR